MKIIKRIIIIFLSFCLTLLILSAASVFWAIKNFGEIEKYKTLIFENIKATSGYSVYAEEISINPSLKPYLPVNVHHFIVYDENNIKLFKSKDICFKIKLLPIIKKKIEIYEVYLNRPVIEVDTNIKREIQISDKPIEYKGFQLTFDIKNLILKNYKFNITDGKQKYSLEGENINLLNSDLKNNIKISTKGLMLEGKKELLNYDVELEIPFDILNKKQSKPDFKQKKYIKANIKAKNIALGKLREVYDFLFNICGIKTPLTEYKISGNGNFDFFVESDFKTLKSKGIVEIKNAEIKHKSIPFSLRNINSRINFKNNNINIESANAEVNNNPVSLSGKINDKFESDIKLEASDIELKNILPLFDNEILKNYNLSSGTVDLKANIKSKNMKEYSVPGNIILRNINISDKISKIHSDELKINFNYTPKSLIADILSDVIKIKLEKQNLNFALKNLSAKFDNKDLIINPSKFAYGNCSLDIEGKIGDIEDENRNIDILAQGNIKATELEKELKKYFKFQSASKGNLPITIKIEGNKDKTKISGKITADKDNYLSLLVIKELLNKPSLLNIMTELKDNELKIDNISLLNTENTKGISSFKLTMDKLKKIIVLTGILNLKDKISAKDLKIQIPDSMTFSAAILDGAELSVKGGINVNGELTNPKIKGEINLNKLKLFNYNLSVKNAGVNFIDDIIKFNVPDITIGDSQFNAEGEVLPKFEDTLIIKNISISSHKCNLNSLIQEFSDIKTSDIFPGIEVPLTIESGSAKINSFSYEDLKLSDVTSDFSLKDNLLSIKNLNSTGFDGTIKGSADLIF